mgnify:CR=1 FL=1
MPAQVVVGTQFGDEGKGKIVDRLADRSDVVARFNGGANAGHTVVVGGERFAFRLLPSGAIRGRQVAIGNGVVVDPDQLLSEISLLEKRGIEVKLWLSDRAHVVLPYHKVLDGAERALKGRLSSGSTKRGIGPCYGDKVMRTGIRVGDLLDKSLLAEKIETYFPLKERLLKSYGLDVGTTKEELLEWCLNSGSRLSRYVVDTSLLLNKALDQGKNVLLEGAQGTHLDIDHGLYPYGTSSNPTAGGACTGTGIPPTKIDQVIGVVKAYTSRVGEGPFPTEIHDDLADWIREKGGEYGTVTRRPRRCGWLDLVMVKYSVRVNGVSSLAMTKMDVLGGLRKVKVCIAYEFQGDRLEEFPSNPRILAECRPILEELPGWEDLPPAKWIETAKAGYESIPKNARSYIEYVEEYTGVPVSIVSLGADREATIERT